MQLLSTLTGCVEMWWRRIYWLSIAVDWSHWSPASQEGIDGGIPKVTGYYTCVRTGQKGKISLNILKIAIALSMPPEHCERMDRKYSLCFL